MSAKKKNHAHLYDVSIDVLNLSEQANKVLLRTGMTTIGDCIDFFIRLPDVHMARPPSLTVVTEIEQKLKDLHYWQYVE